MKRSTLLLCLFALLVPAFLAAAERPAAPAQPSPEALLAAIFSDGSSAPAAQVLPDVLPQPEHRIENCTAFCQTYGAPCRNSGGKCGYHCDDFGTCGCMCWYP